METTKMSNFTCQSKSFISIFFICQISACELRPFSCYNLANDIYSQTAKTVFSHFKFWSNIIPKTSLLLLGPKANKSAGRWMRIGCHKGAKKIFWKVQYCNRYLWDVRIKMYRLPDFYMLIRFLLKSFNENELLSCLQKVDMWPTIAKGLLLSNIKTECSFWTLKGGQPGVAAKCILTRRAAVDSKHTGLAVKGTEYSPAEPGLAVPCPAGYRTVGNTVDSTG